MNFDAGSAATLVLGSGKAGHEANALGVAEALGRAFQFERPNPSTWFAALAPYGPVDPGAWRRIRDAARPSVTLAIGCGRATVPYLRALRRARGDGLFAVFLQDPRASRRVFDLIWVPEHDSLRAANVMTTLTSPHPVTPARLAALRAAPDPRLAALPGPRAGVILGGPSREVAYSPADLSRLGEAVERIAAQGFSVMATPSRRTPPEMLEVVRGGLKGRPAFVWDGAGDNPYAGILALSDALLVTADSANMVGEATATGVPVHVFAAAAPGPTKLASMIAGLKAKGALREFRGALERFTYAPIDSSAAIAREIEKRMRAKGL